MRGGARGGRRGGGGERGRGNKARGTSRPNYKRTTFTNKFDHKKYNSDGNQASDQKSTRGRRAERSNENFYSESKPNPDLIQNNYESEDESSEEEVSNYAELLNVLSGSKKRRKLDIVSESESESDEDSDKNISENDELLLDNDPDNEFTSTTKNNDNLENVLDKIEDLGEEAGENDEESNLELVPGDEHVIEDAELDDDLEKEVDCLDPFILHFERELSGELQSTISTPKPYNLQQELNWPTLEKMIYSGVKRSDKKDLATPNNNYHLNAKSLLDSTKATRNEILIPPSEPKINTLNELHIKTQLQSTIPTANQYSIDKEKISNSAPAPLTPTQSELLSLATNYYDVYYPYRNFENEQEIRMTYCIHAVNHLLKTRTRILHHNAKMTTKVEVPEEYRDQGFVRPKVLILTPFKESALRIVKTLISLILSEEKGNVENKKRFVDEYGGETLFMPKTNPKPDDYVATFSANVDDNFKIGMAITKKTIKLYTGFYSSDLIIASPLGLRLIVGAEGEKDRDYDFLSSIEVLIMDQADIFLMQNWDHVLHLFKHLHMQPVTEHGTNFGRMRPWAIDNLTKFYSQTLIFSSFICPEHLSLFSRHCRNYEGFVKIINSIPIGSISKITVQLPQIFQRFECSSLSEISDARFEYFVTQVVPNFKDRMMSHTLIFVSSYFDFVRIRNYFKKEEQSFVQICEYTKDKKIARARDLFFHGKNHMLLYSERAHFFRRHRLKGIGHIIFYELPQYPHFYPELCNFMQEGFQNRRVRQRKNCSVNVMYCKYDALRLGYIVGTERANHMLTTTKKVHAFVSEDI